MKKNNISLALMLVASLTFSCKNKSDKKESATISDSNTEVINNTPNAPSEDNKSGNTASSTATFDVSKLPVSDKLTGNFPYLILPPGYHFTDPNSSTGSGKNTDYDKEYFFNHGIYTPQEGKSYKANIINDENKTFSKLELKKSFDDFIHQLGGVNINDGEKLKDGEKDRLDKLDPNAYNDNYLFSCNNWDDIHTYVIHSKDKLIWIQVNYGTNEAYMTVLETKAFENKMSQTTAETITEDIHKNGKAVLYINFDIDKSSLLPDGKKTVDEITKVLANDAALKLSIQGHTDDTGNKEHNKALSLARANTVKSNLVQSGINELRLKTIGFGAEKPLAPNDSEENKAKNRRVELVKI